MTTVLTIVTRAMRRVNLVGVDETPDASEAAKWLEGLNAMALGWSAANIHTGWATVTLSDDFPLEAKHEEGVTFMLMKLMASQLLTPDQREGAEQGRSRLSADFKAIEGLRVDCGLQWMPSQRRSW